MEKNYEWNTIPFEIVLPEFQRIVDKFLCSFSQFHVVYRDDVLRLLVFLTAFSISLSIHKSS